MRQERNFFDPVDMRRATAGGFMRTIYAISVIGLGSFLTWQVIKPAIYTESPGIVMAPVFAVSAPYTARVIAMSVAPGARVKFGDLIATIRSPQIDELRANLLRGLAEQTNKEADLRIRLSVARSSLDAARRRQQLADQTAKMIEGIPGGASMIYRTEVVREQSLAAIALAQIEAELAETTDQLRIVEEQRRQFELRSREVEVSYNGGRQVSPASGLVGPRIAHAGESLAVGMPIAEIYDDADLYIEWILSPDRFTQPKPGSVVYVIDGMRVMRGHIVELLRVAERSETGKFFFQKSEAGQLVRIKLNSGENYPPVLTNIEVRYNYWRFMDPAVELFVKIMTTAGLWRDS